NWSIRPGKTKELLSGKINLKDISEDDISYDLRQKGIDMKIGVDIATLTLKKFVTQIVLISGDADFMPASKLARTEGVDFILDPMWNPIDDILFEHIDGLRSTAPRPIKNIPKPTNTR
ncbi:MAG: NYN domain-containing protein, partial [Bacteroidetes bacterium]|nr:NYN domain-containing protein [Bacteroidota bacterium]